MNINEALSLLSSGALVRRLEGFSKAAARSTSRSLMPVILRNPSSNEIEPSHGLQNQINVGAVFGRDDPALSVLRRFIQESKTRLNDATDPATCFSSNAIVVIGNLSAFLPRDYKRNYVAGMAPIMKAWVENKDKKALSFEIIGVCEKVLEVSNIIEPVPGDDIAPKI